MREVAIDRKQVEAWLKNPMGAYLCFPVKVGWPELQLTEQQILENSLAMLGPNPMPHEDQSIFNVVVR